MKYEVWAKPYRRSSVKKVVNLVLLLSLSILVFLPVQGIFVGSYNQKMIEHTLKENIIIQLPPSMQITENPLGERSQLSYSVFINDENLMLRGYIQIWQLDDIEKFLRNNKEMSSYNFYSYTLNNVTIGNLSGQINAWGASFGELTKISGKEYFLRKSETSKILRIAFLTSSATFSKEQDILVNKILSTLRWER
jgi:hypothetical protein